MRLAPGERKSSDWHRRVVRHHFPLAVASGLALLLFLCAPPFDADAYAHADILSATLPRPRPSDGTTSATPNESSQPAVHGAAASPGPTHGPARSAAVSHGASSAPSTAGATHEPVRGPSARDLTVGTGYVALGLLATTLLVGPVNLLRARRTPVSSYLRRDVGMWTAVFSVAHVLFGLQVHATGAGVLGYFFAPDGRPWLNSFGLGNWTGLLATVIVVGLLALSSDVALRRLKAGPWKWLQRLNYALFGLTIAHAVFYGAVLRASSPYTLLLAVAAVAVVVGQAAGIVLWRRRSERPARGAAVAR